MFREFPRFDETNAPADARGPLSEVKRAFGGVPAPLARYASSPRMLRAALSGLDTFDGSSLGSLEREVLAMTMGRQHGCRFCIHHHRQLLRRLDAPAELIDALEQGQPLASPRLESLRAFVLAALEHHGDVPPRTWSDFREAGYTHAQALDVLLGISVYTLTTFANRLTEAG